MGDNDKERAKQIIVEVIRQAGGTFDNKTNLFKAFYYAHLLFAESQPGYLSSWPIVRMPRGPGIHRFDILLGELMAEGKVETKQISKGSYSGFRFQVSGKAETHDLLTAAAIESIADAVKRVEGRSAEQVSHDSHETSRAWRNSKDGDELNIYVDLIPDEEYQARKARMQQSAEAFADWG